MSHYIENTNTLPLESAKVAILLCTMRKLHVFGYWDRLQAALLKEILVAEGIDCILRNDQLSSAIGEIPFVECSPELWIVDGETYPRAKLLLDAWLQKNALTDEYWICPNCGEQIQGHFGACWSCGTINEINT